MRIRAYSITIPLAIMSLTAISSGQSNLGDVPWVDATEDSDGGSIAVLSTLVDNHSSFSSSVSEAPILIEVYTATWCETCIPAEDALDSETSELDVEIIKFHRHLFEVEDPFGNNNTEGRWLSRYGPASAAAEQSSRTPPTIIVSGERMHIGSTPSPGMTLAEEYRESLNLVTSPPISENSSLEITWDGQILDWSWEWEEEKSRCRTACDSVTTDLTLLIRETSGDFPEGANGQGVYYNILRDAMPLDAAGSTNLELPSAWDGDDLELVFIVDWVEHSPKTSLFQELPFENPLSVIVIIFLGAIFAPLTRKFDAGFNNPR